MRMYDLLCKKKQGQELSTEEIQYMIQGFTKGEIPDYQMSAMTMAICFQGLSPRETVDMTLAMRDSGAVMDLSEIHGKKVDKHSTGGVGDKVSLILAPLVASLGVPVAKMSGRGLGHTGGTIDKLESIEGFSTELSEEKFTKSVNSIGMAIAGQTADLAPADKKMYALRDVTATVDEISLIASSIMSKKLASGADAIVLDVKTGNGAFMTKEADAKALAHAMVDIGKRAGKDTVAVITQMEQPLGYAVGNALEVREAIASLQGNGPQDLMEVVYALGAHMLVLGERATDTVSAIELLQEAIVSGKAWEKFQEFIVNQGGNLKQLEDIANLPKAQHVIPVISNTTGYVQQILAQDIGLACMMLGGGRVTKESIIDPAVGIVLEKKIGDSVSEGDILAYIHANDEQKAQNVIEKVRHAYLFSEKKVQAPTMIKAVISE